MNRSQNSAKANPFTEEELELAQLFKAYALEWTPLPGQYVLDQEHVLPHESPFQPHVFFILDLDHFVRYTGSVERFREAFCWLPTWEQARRLPHASRGRRAWMRFRLSRTSQAIELSLKARPFMAAPCR